MQYKDKIISIKKELYLFRHKIKGTVRFEDAGPGNRVHQNKILYWIEWARTQYYRDIGVAIDRNTFPGKYFHVIVHTSCDFYYTPGFLDDYEILSRAAYIKNSSVGMEHIVRNNTGEIIAKEKVVLVFMDHETNTSHPVPDHFRKSILKFEGNNVEIL